MKASSWIIALCCLVTVIASVFPSVAEFLAFTPSDLYHLRLWTLVTALFLHSGLLHLVGNMIFLFVLGRTLERVTNTKKFLTVFFVGGIASFLLSVPFYKPDVLMVGASAAIFSVASADMLIAPLSFSIIFLAPAGAIALLYFLYNIIAVYYGISGNVAYISHIIGFAVGIPFGILWSKQWKKNLGISIILLIIYVIISLIVSRLIADILPSMF
jgi:rhomboid family protein